MRASCTSFPLLENLLTSMSAQDSTNGWDIVCSYSIDVLNEILATSHENGTLVHAVQFTVQGTLIDGSSYTADFDIALGAPVMQFLADQSGECQLTMPLTGTYSINGGTVQSLPAGYSLIANVPLGAMYGDGEIATVGNVVSFTEGQQAQAHIVLHFKNGTSSGTFFIIQPQPPDQFTELFTIILPNLQNYFQSNVNEIDYALTALSNIAVTASSDTVTIVPKSFVFASNEGVLSLYIVTENSGNGQGNLRPSFQPGGTETIPIPEGYTSSLIFSKSFLEKVYFTASAAGSQILSFLVLSSPVGLSLAVTANIAELNINPSYVAEGTQFLCDDIIIDYTVNPFLISFAGSQASIAWGYEKTVNWQYTFSMPGQRDSTTENGESLVKISLPGSLPGDTQNKLTSNLVLQENDITLNFQLSAGDYTIDTTSNNSIVSFGHIVSEKVTSYLDNNIPSIAFHFGGINYFAATNLLFPDRQTFNSAGVYVPRDLLLVGNIHK